MEKQQKRGRPRNDASVVTDVPVIHAVPAVDDGQRSDSAGRVGEKELGTPDHWALATELAQQLSEAGYLVTQINVPGDGKSWSYNGFGVNVNLFCDTCCIITTDGQKHFPATNLKAENHE